MTFAWPHLFWLTLVPVALFLWELTHRRRADVSTHPKILRAEAGDRGLNLVRGDSSAARSARVRPWLWLGLVLCIVAAARPQWGRLEEPVFDQAREIIIAVDLSRSMLTPDIKPTRLDRAKLLTQSLLERLEGERVGLVVFSGTAFLQSPLSADYEILREFLPALDPDFLPEGGTNYRALIDTAIDAFASTAAADRFLIVLSDGESTVEDWRNGLDALRDKGVRVIGLGIGTAAGAMIPDGSGGLVKDERGAVVMSKLEPATLQELATATNGVYQDASSWIDLAALIETTVETGRKGEFTEKNSVRLVERFQWPLALGLWLLLVSFYYEFPVRPKPRELKLNQAGPNLRPRPNTPPAPPAPPPEITVSVLCVLFSILGTSLSLPSVRAAESPAPPEPPPLAKIVGRLSQTPQRTARDWAELGRETVTWGSRLQSTQEPVPEGPIRDALTAVELGSQLDPKTADWPKLREELEALLQKPEDQQQQQQQQQNQDQQKDQQKQDQPQQDQSKQDQSQKGDPQQQKDQEQQSKESSDQKEQNQPPPDQEKSSSEQESAFGDMQDQPRPPPPPQETQKVGGVPEKKEGDAPPLDPALALPLQKLDQLKNQDSPAELFKLMEGEKDQTPRTKSKDW